MSKSVSRACVYACVRVRGLCACVCVCMCVSKSVLSLCVASVYLIALIRQNGT